MIVAHDISHGLNANQQVRADGLRRRDTIKQAMRAAMARSELTVHEALAETIKAIPQTECENYIHNAGYGST